MKTYFEIVENKNYRELSITQKEEIQNRQTELVLQWQDESDVLKKEVIFEELYASLIGLIKGTAYRKALNSYSVDQDDFEGLLNLVLVETLISFDRTLNKPFQPIYMLNVNNAIKMMYRQKSYDAIETCTYDSNRLDNLMVMELGSGDVQGNSPTSNFHSLKDMGSDDVSGDAVTRVLVKELVTKLFGDDEIKKTIAIMYTEGFKREQILKAVAVEGELPETAKKRYTRTVNTFKEYAGKVMQAS